MIKKNFVVFGTFGLMAAVAQAANLGVSAELGTAGGGVHLVIPIKPEFNARVGVNTASYHLHRTVSDVDYDAKFKLNTWDALLDYYPWSGSFRMTGGIIYNNNKATATAKPTAGTYTFNGTTYNTSDVGTVQANINFRKVAPYLGIGWGNAVAADKGWGFTSDIGVMFQGAAQTSLVSSGCTADAVTCARLQTDLAAENQSLSDNLKSFRAFPVIRLGLSYRF